jgi:hypothetical protein
MKNGVWIGILMTLSLSGCYQSEYQKILKRELARNVRYDSLFLGLGFGMEAKQFYTHCWELNKKGLIMQGPSNLFVQYELHSPDVKSKTYMWFYPDFSDNKISKMRVEFSYEAYAPWNAELANDKLLEDIKNLFEKWYGGTFIKETNKAGDKTVWVKVDGNRRIRLFIKNVSTVAGDFSDMTLVNSETENIEK